MKLIDPCLVRCCIFAVCSAEHPAAPTISLHPIQFRLARHLARDTDAAHGSNRSREQLQHLPPRPRQHGRTGLHSHLTVWSSTQFGNGVNTRECIAKIPRIRMHGWWCPSNSSAGRRIDKTDQMMWSHRFIRRRQCRSRLIASRHYSAPHMQSRVVALCIQTAI